MLFGPRVFLFQAEIISHHFCQLLAPDDVSTNTIKSYAPCAMITPFTGDEIYEAAKSMKNGKISGIDDIHAEHIKYAPPSIHENIAHYTKYHCERWKPTRLT